MKRKIKKVKHKGICNVPMIMQLEALECGAACLTMIMAYFGKWVPLEEVRVESGVSRDGVNAGNLLRAGEHYGLASEGFKCDIDSLKREGNFPCIIHWNFNHFVVLTGFRGGYAYINDPARGKVKVPMSEFNTSFTGIVLEFSPSESFVANGKKRSVLSFAKQRLSASISALVFMIITVAIFSLLKLLEPLFPKFFVDNILTNETPQWFIPFICILSAVTLFEIVVSAISNYQSYKFMGKVSVTGSGSYMWKVINLPLGFFSQRHVADLQNRKNDNTRVAQNLILVIAPAFINVLLMIFYLVVMVMNSYILTIIGVFSVLLNVLVGYIASKRRINIAIVQLRDKGLLDSSTINSISMIETIKASGAESGVYEKWAGHQANLNNDEINALKVEIRLASIPLLISALVEVAILIMGVYLVFANQLTIGAIMAFQGLFLGFSLPVNEIINSGQVIMETRSQMERIEDVMKYPLSPVFKEDDFSSIDSLDKINGDIEIKNVSFGYSKLDEPLLKNFSLTIKQGSKIAIVGSSGCGKSTLAKLLCGLYAPWEGEITFGNKKMSEIERTTFASSVSMVDQNIILFEDTIQNNITMWNDSIEDYEMILAAKDAQIHNTITSRPGGYQHKLIENGGNFSGGERQRLEIARALAQEPNYLILDEATSALDAKTENEVVKSISNRGITTIVVAHRLSTIRDAELIIVMDKGSIVEQGTHDELISLQGYYYKLVKSE